MVSLALVFLVTDSRVSGRETSTRYLRGNADLLGGHEGVSESQGLEKLLGPPRGYTGSHKALQNGGREPHSPHSAALGGPTQFSVSTQLAFSASELMVQTRHLSNPGPHTFRPAP